MQDTIPHKVVLLWYSMDSNTQNLPQNEFLLEALLVRVHQEALVERLDANLVGANPVDDELADANDEPVAANDELVDGLADANDEAVGANRLDDELADVMVD